MNKISTHKILADKSPNACELDTCPTYGHAGEIHESPTFHVPIIVRTIIGNDNEVDAEKRVGFCW